MNRLNAVQRSLAKWTDGFFLVVVAHAAATSLMNHNFGDPVRDPILQWYALVGTYAVLSGLVRMHLDELAFAARAGLAMGLCACLFYATSDFLSADRSAPISWPNWLALALTFLGRTGSGGRTPD